MTSVPESVQDKNVLNLTATPCEICGPSTYDEEMIGCDGCTGWFHFRCVGISGEKLPEKWYCQSKACQEKAQEYQKDAEKHALSGDQAEDSDKASVDSPANASSLVASLQALEESSKRQYESFKVEMQLRKKEKMIQLAFESMKVELERELQLDIEKKKMELELQRQAEEERQQKVWQAEMLGKKTEQIKRMKANQAAFEEQMAVLDATLTGLSVRKVPKVVPKTVESGIRAGPSGKSNENQLQRSKKH